MADTTLLTLLDTIITKSENKRQSGYQTLIYNKLLELSKNNAETASLLGLDAEILAEAQTAEAMSEAIQEIVTDKVNSALAGGGGSGGSSIDLSNYYKKSETDQRIQQALANGSQSDWSITDTSKAAYIKNKPTKLSQFENDTNFLTSHQSLEAYATKTYVQDLLSQGNFDIDLSDYILVDNLDNAVSTLGYLKTIPSEYVTISQLEGKNYLTQNALEPYITETELNEKGFLTEHQSLADYATRAYVQEYSATKDWVTEYVVGVTTNGEIDLSAYASKMYVDDIATAIRKEIPVLPDLTPYATQTWVTEQLAAYNPEGVDEDAVKAIVEAYGYLTAVPDTYATKDYVAEQLSNFEVPSGSGGSADLSIYYTKEETDNLLLDYLLSNDYAKDKHIKIVDNLNEPLSDEYKDYLSKTVFENNGNLVYIIPNTSSDTLYGLVYISDAQDAYSVKTETNMYQYINGADDTGLLIFGDFQYSHTYKVHTLTGNITTIGRLTEDVNDGSILRVNRYDESKDDFYQVSDNTSISANISLNDIKPEYHEMIKQIKYVNSFHNLMIGNDPIIMWGNDHTTVGGYSTQETAYVINYSTNTKYIVDLSTLQVGMNKTYKNVYIVKTEKCLTANDLSSYATQTWVTEKIASAALGGGSGDSGINIEELLSIYATKDEVNTLEANMNTKIPTKISQLQNDTGYLTSIPEDTFSKYLEKTEFYALYSPEDPWVRKSEMPIIPGVLSAFTNDLNFATETFVTSKIAEAAFSAAGIDLSAYALKSYVDSKIPTVPTKISEFENDKKYISETSLTYGASENYILSYKGGTYVWIDSSSFSSGGGTG